MNTSIKIKDVTDYLELQASPSYQESYDNSGLLTGDPMTEVTGILVTLDCTEAVVAEAIHSKCNLIVAHHPIVFKGLKKLTGSTYIERVVISAIKNDVAIYAIHTNLDNISTGVNRKICERIGLQGLKILSPKKDTLSKLVTFIPKENAETVLSALYDAGAGQIGNYRNCSFRVEGTGTFTPGATAKPHIGKALVQEQVQEIRAELIFPTHLGGALISALRKTHPYEEIAYYITSLNNENQEVGSGMIGELEHPVEPLEFLKGLKVRMQLDIIRHTRIPRNAIQKIAVCGGSGSFLLNKAIQAGADVFITADFKYHDFFDAENKIIVADIGHYESEAFTKELIMDVLIKKFPNFAINFSKTITNPISYL
ncbi:MAG: Nif3-like dinuclear metal center hexameric protein [Cyclobacteriaceae bacterium]|nr:Nif3-like dinuclear metal center hexameric protein [Cyclobacteriaceae bacterium]MDH4296596.1 Nif3-like dinuclear metal center hexameric protein [Cyclobacteriaceae bacterium]MDH5250220.1 Nif3-like dinuclear metal center hexameric protein [Cyclobacteriaceae bacterium]